MTSATPTTCPEMTPLTHEMILLTQAELDGELNAAEAIAAGAHRATCAECQAAYRVIRAVRSAMRSQPTNYTMPAGARQKLLARLRQAGSQPTPPARDDPATTPGVSWWRTGMTFGAG